MIPPAAESGDRLDVTINTTVKPGHCSAAHSAIWFKVTNRSAVEDRDVMVRVAFPLGLTPRKFATRGPMGTPFVIEDNMVAFDRVPSLPAGEQLEYTIIVEAKQAAEELCCPS